MLFPSLNKSQNRVKGVKESKWQNFSGVAPTLRPSNVFGANHTWGQCRKSK